MSSTDSCFETLKPTLREIGQLIKTAPVTEQERVNLAAQVAGYMIGIAAATTGMDVLSGTKAICDAIVESVEKASPPKH